MRRMKRIEGYYPAARRPAPVFSEQKDNRGRESAKGKVNSLNMIHTINRSVDDIRKSKELADIAMMDDERYYNSLLD